MHAAKSVAEYSGISAQMLGLDWVRVTHTAASPAARRGRNSQRRYQPEASKHSTKESRYSASGSTQRKGIAAILSVMWLVKARSRVDAQAASAAQSAWRATSGLSGASMGEAGASALRPRHASPAHSRAN